jgi:hypothetical protein
MKHHSIGANAVLVLLVSAGLATGQTSTTPTFATTVTTGMVGWAPASQTAQLNVLNTGAPVPTATSPTTTAGACPVELQFFDGQNNLLKSLSVTNVASGTAASLTLKLSDLTAAPSGVRLDIRGAVKSNPLVTTTTTTTIPPGSGSTIISPFTICSFVTTMELYDSTTGVTQTLTSDTHPFGTLIAVPLALL